MFGSHFYHATMRKSVAVFGTMFNNISVVRLDGSGGILNQIKVPLAYGPKQKFLSRIDQDTMGDASMAIKLPRMSFEISSLSVDSNKKENKRNTITADLSTDNTKRQTINAQVPYNIGMQLSIMTKNQDDGLQILEQILPYFQPDYTVTIKPIDGWTNFKQDVPIILNDVSIDDQYDGDYVSRRVLTYTINFTMKMTFYSGAGSSKVIKNVDIDWLNKSNNMFLEGQNFAVNPTTATEDDTLVTGSPGSDQYAITSTIDYLNVPSTMTLTLSSVSGTFVVNEIVTGGTSGTTAKVTSISGTTMAIADPTGYFYQSETLTGGTSTATATINQAV
jgi:hypothetical protein